MAKRKSLRSPKKIMRVHPGGSRTIKRSVRKRTATIIEKKNGTTRYRFPIPDKCLAGDTLIALLDGRNMPIADLVGQEVWVYGYDIKQRAIVPTKATNIHKTIEKVEVYEIELDNGSKIICTGNHPFLLKNGYYVEAEKLRIGDSLMPLYRRIGNPKGGYMEGYEHIFQPYYGKWELTHKMVWREYHKLPIEKGYVVHHEDSNRTNNVPENLILMDRAEHARMHPVLKNLSSIDITSRWADVNRRRKASSLMVKRNGCINKPPKEELENLYLEKKLSADTIAEMYGVSRSAVSSWFNEYGINFRKGDNEKLSIPPAEELKEKYISLGSLGLMARVYGVSRPTVRKWMQKRNLWETGKGCLNHKVMKVQKLEQKIDVYDMETTTHNFALTCGVFVHNSHARNALARLPQAKGLSAAEKKKIRDRAYKVLYGTTSKKEIEKKKKKRRKS